MYKTFWQCDDVYCLTMIGPVGIGQDDENGRPEWRFKTIPNVSSASAKVKEPPGLGTQAASFTQPGGSSESL
jgi:hypothetical protein